MSAASDRIRLSLTLEQQRQIARHTGVSLPWVEVSRLDMARLMLSALAARSDILPISDQPQTRAHLLEVSASEGTSESPVRLNTPAGERLALVFAASPEQRALIAQATGREMGKFALVPGEWDIAYGEQWREAPIRAGQFTLIAPQNASLPPHEESHYVVRLPAPNADGGDSLVPFGTGRHPTTQLMIGLIEETVRPGDRVLDVGTGTGVLAVLAAQCGAKQIEACDIDSRAVALAHRVIALNKVEDRVRLYDGDLSLIQAADFDVVLANLLAEVHLQLAGQLAAKLRPGGCLLASGIISERASEIVGVFESHGCRLQQQLTREGWSALALVK
jgi:ribosomal protein L11 methyltransferase